MDRTEAMAQRRSSQDSPSHLARLPDNCLELIISRLIDACAPTEVAEALGTCKGACKSLHRAWQMFAGSETSEKLVGWVLEHEGPQAAMERLLKLGLQKPAAFAALAATGHAHGTLAV